MALINCPECNHQISDKAVSCPNCGYPLDEIPKNENAEEKINNDFEKVKIDKKLLDDIYEFENGAKILMMKTLSKVSKCSLKEAEYIVNKYFELRFPSKNLDYVFVEDTKPNKTAPPPKKFEGIYRSTLFSGLQEVYCPRCGSEKCSHYQKQEIVPAKIKTRYTVNLNPLKPFTFANKKEKVVRNEQIITKSAFLCNKCGYIFY